MAALTESLATTGRIDRAVVENEALRVDGWVVSLGSEPVDGFKLSIGGKEVTDFQIQSDVASPDIKRAFPLAPGAEHARYSIVIPLDDRRRARVRDSLLVLRPTIKGREDNILLKIVEPSLPVPSEQLNNLVGGGNFVAISNEFLGYFIRLAGLLPTEQVLDVGCGVGRMAYSLVYYLTPPGRYEGFDIMTPLVQWASDTISPRYPNFTFRTVDIANQAYNPTGAIRSIDFVFPYRDESFDFVFLTSVFTHMYPPDVRHYLDEIRRVLKPGGRCLCTCFLINEESQRLLAEDKGMIKIVHKLDECFTANLENPEHAIGFSEPVLLRWIGERGFTISGKYYGSWCGRGNFISSHDLLVFAKP